MIFMDVKCVRCGKKIPELKHLIQVIEYLGKSEPRQPICDECFDAFQGWLKEILHNAD